MVTDHHANLTRFDTGCYSPPVLAPSAFARRQMTLFDHRIRTLPVLVLMPHSRCNCRCVMCDIWKANARKQELGVDDLAPHLADLATLDVSWIVLSGGEALMHANLFTLCRALRDATAGRDLRITLLSTGLLLPKHAQDVVREIDEVIVSLDGTPEVHDAIRNIPRAFDKLARGVEALRAQCPDFPITARCVLQRRNVHVLGGIIETARDTLGLDRLSFLTADVSSEAFNRAEGWEVEQKDDVGLAADQAEDFTQRVDETLVSHADAFASGFVAESPERMRGLAQYFRACAGLDSFPPIRCNAPWTSAVIETDGTIRPCFFHPGYGNLGDGRFEQVINSPDAIGWRRQLDMATDETCQRCVCTLHLSPWQRVG